MKLKSIFPLTILCIAALLLQNCKKSNSDSDKSEVRFEKITSLAELEKLRTIQFQSMKNGINLVSKEFSENELTPEVNNVISSASGRSYSVESTCIPIPLFMKSLSVEYRNGDCMTPGNYQCFINWRVLPFVGQTFISPTTWPAKVSYTIGGIATTITLSPVIESTSPTGTTVYNYSFPLPDYCSITDFNFTITPQVTCEDGATYTADQTVTFALGSYRSDACNNLAPISVDPSVAGKISLGGWFSCSNPVYNPCITFPEAVEFSYRLAGSSTWTIYSLNPYAGFGASISSLSPGNYEVRWRNKKVTSPTCFGPYSDIKTYTVH